MLIEIDLTSDVPLYQQIRDQIILGIGRGDLEFGEELPSVRQLAEDLEVNPMTVNKAYQVLKQEGVIEVDRRVGTKVKNKPGNVMASDYRKRLEILLGEGLAKTEDVQAFKKKVHKVLEELGERRE